jgi:CheY-like chemotaxis protein
VAVSVSDTGTGIDPKILPRIFEPFFTTKEVSKGTGLGLSLVYGFTHQSGGGVWAESAPGLGTTVTMYLPRSLNAGSKPSPHTEWQSSEQTSGTVLVVEDNPEVAKVSSLLLDQIGYKVVVVSGPEAALRELAVNGSIDLVFSDVVMPGEINGVQLAGLIRERYPQMPILLTSGYSNAAHAAEQQFPLLRKPYQISALADALSALRSTSQSKP